MKLLVFLLIITPLFSFSQSRNNLHVFTRPVILNTKRLNNVVVPSANIYISAECDLKVFKNRSALSSGFYMGTLLAPEIWKYTGPKVFNQHKENRRFTFGLAARYKFYASKNNKLTTFLGIACELNLHNSEHTRQNLTGDTIPGVNMEIEVIPPLLPYQTTKTIERDSYLDFFVELGGSYYFNKRWGASLSGLFSLYDYSYRLNTGVNYRF
ncbi:MAG: hypothetical protein M0D57_06005 [Sphingobacteriales bacterium JAD_PAG50586_3]|nr:MAG: hypothetical protein M0D57_06005 [Sphingobacteriales bacterium JAD_PAG50586_3]